MEKAKTKFTISILDSARATMPLMFKQSIAHGVWVDWGDDDYPETFDTVGVVRAEHTYPEAGDYDITMYTVDDCVLELGGMRQDWSVIGADSEGYRYMLQKAVIGDDVHGIGKYAFCGCGDMQEIAIPDTLTYIGEHAFDSCYALESIVIPAGIAEIRNGTFMNCMSLKSVTVPEGVAKIADYAFYNCSQMREIDLTHVVEIGKYAFEHCKNLRQIMLSENAAIIGDFAFESCTSVHALQLGGVKTIGKYAFGNCRTLSQITLPASVATIGDGVFVGCNFINKVVAEAATPPVMQSENAFDTLEAFTISVPEGALEAYTAATNWTVYAENMEEVAA